MIFCLRTKLLQNIPKVKYSVKIVVLVVQGRCVLVRFNGFCFRTRTAVDLNSQKVTLQILIYFVALKLIPEEHKLPVVALKLMYNKRTDSL